MPTRRTPEGGKLLTVDPEQTEVRYGLTTVSFAIRIDGAENLGIENDFCGDVACCLCSEQKPWFVRWKVSTKGQM